MKKKIIPILIIVLILIVILCIVVFGKKKDVNFDSSKMLTNASNIKYEVNDFDTNIGLEITIKDGKPFLTTDTNNEKLEFMFPLLIETVKDKELTGFSGKVVDTYQAYMGNGDPKPILLFLMKDGSVEYIKSSSALEQGIFESQGKINELSDIVKFQSVDAYDVDENGETLSGWITVVAINKKGYSYDLSTIDYLQETYGF